MRYDGHGKNNGRKGNGEREKNISSVCIQSLWYKIMVKQK